MTKVTKSFGACSLQLPSPHIKTSNVVVRRLRRVTAARLLELGCTPEDRVLAGTEGKRQASSSPMLDACFGNGPARELQHPDSQMLRFCLSFPPACMREVLSVTTLFADRQDFKLGQQLQYASMISHSGRCRSKETPTSKLHAGPDLP